MTESDSAVETLARGFLRDGIKMSPRRTTRIPLSNPFAGTRAESRLYQVRIVTKASKLFDESQSNGLGVLVQSPVGSGKTAMGLAVARYLQRTHGLSVGWVAMRRNLLSQAEQENRRLGFDVEMKLISMFEKDPPQVDMLVVDEAHHDATESMANLHDKVRPQKVLGLTATPFRTDDQHLCFQHVIRDVGINQLILDGYLSPYHHFTIPKYTAIAVARFIMRERERWGKSLVYFHRKDECEQCQRILARTSIASDVVTATTDRERQIAAFEDGRLDVLINMMVLSEGFDCPSLKTVFCRPSVKNATIQMCGRVFRKHPEMAFKQIVQCSDARHPFVATATPDQKFLWLEGEWRSLTSNEHTEAISRYTRQLLACVRPELPPILVKGGSRTINPETFEGLDSL